MKTYTLSLPIIYMLYMYMYMYMSFLPPSLSPPCPPHLVHSCPDPLGHYPRGPPGTLCLLLPDHSHLHSREWLHSMHHTTCPWATHHSSQWKLNWYWFTAWLYTCMCVILPNYWYKCTLWERYTSLSHWGCLVNYIFIGHWVHSFCLYHYYLHVHFFAILGLLSFCR